MRHTKSNLHKLEQIFKDLDYKVRYEKGFFQSGYCLVQNRKIVIINRFFDIEARMNCLLDILAGRHEDLSELSEENQKVLGDIQHSILNQRNLFSTKI
jgi:hypothetical protein